MENKEVLVILEKIENLEKAIRDGTGRVPVREGRRIMEGD